jgi:hypothetical protein
MIDNRICLSQTDNNFKQDSGEADMVAEAAGQDGCKYHVLDERSCYVVACGIRAARLLLGTYGMHKMNRTVIFQAKKKRDL